MQAVRDGGLGEGGAEAADAPPGGGPALLGGPRHPGPAHPGVLGGQPEPGVPGARHAASHRRAHARALDAPAPCAGQPVWRQGGGCRSFDCTAQFPCAQLSCKAVGGSAGCVCIEMRDSKDMCTHFLADRVPVLVQALKLLGKFGGRNRRFLMDPLELDLKSNPEHGLRLILTFQPATSFLVPLDRCLSLASQNLFNSTCEASVPEASLDSTVPPDSYH